MKRFLALILTVSILFSMAAMTVTAVGEQGASDDVVYVDEPVGATGDLTAAEETTPGSEETTPIAENTHTDHAVCPCGISGASCASHSSAAEAVVWQEWKSTTSLPTTAGNYYLTGEVTLSKQQLLNADIKICLNGFDIKQGTRTEAAGSRNGIIRVGDVGTVTIMNCKATISGGRLAAGSAGIKGFTSDGTSGGAFHVNAGRTLNLYGVQVSGNSCTNTNANGWTAGGILVVSDASKPSNLNVAYSRFDSNKAPNARGGAIIIRGGTADIRNTVFAGNEAKSLGGAIYMVNQASNVNITNCDFTGNKVTDGSAEGGACMYINTGSATLKNVTMTGNENAGNHGTVITYGGTSSLTLDDCTITGNNNTNKYNAKKAGLAAGNNNASITVIGATKIDNNMNGTGGSSPVECNLYLRTSGSKLTVGTLEDGASIRVSTGDHTVSDDPDVFMVYSDKTSVIDPQSQDWIIYENREYAGDKNCIIGYKADTDRFYFGAISGHRHADCACGISGAICADHTSAAEAVVWKEWKSTTSLPTDEGHYYLTGNVVLSSQQVFNNKTAICLNGFSITQGTRTEATGNVGSLLRVYKGALTLINCCAELSNGKLVSNDKTSKISGGTADTTQGGAIYVDPGKSLAVYGIEICDNTCTNANVNGWTAGGILAVANENDALKLTINYCRFSRNKAPNASGGAIILRGGTADIRNTVFEGNEAKTKGGAIWMMNKAPVLTMVNCDFTGNKTTDTAASGGAGIYLDYGSATLTGVTMTGNENKGNHGTAITYGGTSSLILDDCTITGNNNTSSSNAKKGGIGLVNSNASLTIKGATIIDNNMNGKGGTSPVECNLYLRTAGSKLTIDKLEEGASIRVSTGDHTVTDEPDVFLAYTKDTPVMIASENPWVIYENREREGIKACYVGYSNDDERFYFDSDTSHSHTACACAITGADCDVTETSVRWTEWSSTTSLPTEAGYYYLAGEVTLSSQQVINADIHICLNGFDIKQGTRTEATGSRNAIIRVGDSGTLTIVNCQAVITDGKLAEDSAGIKGFTSDGTSGGAFHVNSGRTLNLYGVQVSGNTNTNTNANGWTAGAILAVANDNDNLKLNIAYCRFADNKATNATGGAIIIRGGAADISNTVFEGNEAKTKGGAIYMMNKSSTVTITDCDFIGNKVTDKSSEGGAALYINTGSATMTGVNMTGNENAGNHGTAITYGGNSILTLDDCTVMNNTNTSTSNAKKGAIACVNDNAALTVKGVTVIDNNLNGTNSSKSVVCNLYLRTSKSKLTVDALEAGSLIRVTTGDHTVDNDPDVFLKYTANTPVMEAKTQPWIIYENREQAGNGYYIVSYSNDSERFYFGVASDHNHTACICSIDGITCDSHDDPADAVVYGWSEWTSTTSLPTEAGYYYLAGDVTLSKQQFLTKDVKLCLNGYSITEGTRTEEEGKRNAIIRVGDEGSLTLVNCKATVKDGRLAADNAGIKGFTADGTSGGAIHVNANASLKVIGVVFSDNTNINENPNGWTAGAILVVYENDKPAPSLEIAYSRFDGNKAVNSSGGAVIIRGGTAEISNTVFANNEAGGEKSVGGALWLTNINPQLTMTDCDFTGNKLTDADSQGGAAFYMTKGTAVLTNVTMTGNENTGHHGTAICLGGDADLTLDDCKITNNTNTNAYSAKKAGVATVSDNVKLTVSGATVVDNNMNGTSGTASLECNIYLRTSKAKLTVGQLEKGANIHVSTGDHNVDSFGVTQPVKDPDVFLTKGVDGNWDPAWDSSWITYDNNGLKVGYSYDEQIQFYFEEPKGHVHCLCGDGNGTGCKHGSFGWVAWDRTDCLPTTTGNYYLTADVVAIKTQNFAGTSQVNICLNGHNITPAKGMNSVLLNVYDDAHLSISDCTATGSGTGYKAGKITGAKDGGVRIGKTENGKDAVLNLYDGMITKNQREYYGGGIRMVGQSTFNMYGGAISNNKCYKAHGGGIGAESGAVINIYGGTISGNTANQSGGGIMAKKSTVNVRGGIISSNYATDNGGGIYGEHSSVYISGGTFCYNKAPNVKNAKGNTVGQGGAVFVRGLDTNKYGIKLRISGGNFYGNEAVKGGAVLTLTYVGLTITGGRFSQNTASNNGGGVFPANDTKGTISGCTITENKAVSGAGVVTYLAQIDFSDCVISNNTATDHGAGILIQRESEITMDNVQISNNTAQKYGGALRIDNKAQLSMKDCLVEGNTTGETGTIFASGDGTLITMDGCTVQKNKAGISGGGISAMSYARIIMNSGAIKENSCLQFGGGAYIRKGYMELHGGEITNNTAVESGGGLHIEGVDIIMQRDILLMTDGVVSGNTAAVGGGARFLSGKSTVTGGTFENNTADYGGGIAGGSTGWTFFENIEVKNNIATVNGGGMYLDRGSRNVLTDCTVTGNHAKQDGAGIWIDDDFTAQNLTVTGNTSDSGVGGVYIAPADYDGHSYVSSVIKIGGKVVITDNKGTDPGMFISEGSLVNVAGSGLTSGTKIDVKLQSGLLTRTVIGTYNYEGGNLEYVITDGDRSVTDPEKVPVEETEPVTDPVEEETQEPGFPWLIVAIAGGALLLILILILILLGRKKKNGKENS